MHTNILSKSQNDLLPLIKEFKKNFYLAGGTAIALSIGHRKSIDFDLFTPKQIRPQTIENAIRRAGYDIEHTMVSTIDEYTIIVDGVKVSFISYPFKIVADSAWNDIARLPNLLTLASMKAYTLGRRAKWKDYVDLYFLIRDHFSLKVISDEAMRIFTGGFNSRIFREQLAYFDGIDYSEEVEFMPDKEASNEDVQNFLSKTSIS